MKTDLEKANGILWATNPAKESDDNYSQLEHDIATALAAERATLPESVVEALEFYSTEAYWAYDYLASRIEGDK